MANKSKNDTKIPSWERELEDKFWWLERKERAEWVFHIKGIVKKILNQINLNENIFDSFWVGPLPPIQTTIGLFPAVL